MNKGEAMKTEYRQLPLEMVELDYENPRIARMLEIYKSNEIPPEAVALALGSSEASYESLKSSILTNQGIINPIVVQKIDIDKYKVIEGNTRVQIYRKFVEDGEKGNWKSINAIVYEDVDSTTIHSIRLQAHLIGPRDWDAYSKGKYLYYLKHEALLPMNVIISYCGGKASEVKNMIEAYIDMEKYYRPLCTDDFFNHKNYSAFIEIQRKAIVDSLAGHKYGKKDFAKWLYEEKFDRLEDIRQLPNILNSPNAMKEFLKHGSKAAIKILAVEEITNDKLKDIPYELLAAELKKRMVDISVLEITYLATDIAYSDKLQKLQNVFDAINFVLEEVRGKSI